MSSVSKFNDIFDYFVDYVQAKLPNHLLMSDPYNLIKNTDSEYRQGFGFRFRAGNNTENLISCQALLAQNVELIICRISQSHETEGEKKYNVQKQLMDDSALVWLDALSNPSLGSSLIVSCEYLGNNGIDFIKADRDDLVFMTSSYNFKYREALNA